MGHKAQSALPRGLVLASTASMVSVGLAVVTACGAGSESGPTSVVTHTVTQTAGPTPGTQTHDTGSVMTGDYTPPIATGTIDPATTTPPLVSTETTTAPPLISTPPPTTDVDVPSESDPDVPSPTPEP
ncbi:hypothetical protein ACGFK1_14770 [Mycobacterium sp. NPDC048908]|uniref:hypothetical protein n=1 Tax=Mycobacterium sp. NPDC048908 TaxID=3364292 RepID=UPI003724B9EC